MRRTTTLLLACMALACGDDSVFAPGEVLPVVSLSGVSVALASRMSVTVSNIGYGSFSYGSCAMLIERGEGDAWAPIPEYRNRNCSAVAMYLPPGAARTFTVPRPTEVGLYRVRFVVRHRERDIGLLSPAFGVGVAVAANLRPPPAVESQPPN